MSIFLAQFTPLPGTTDHPPESAPSPRVTAKVTSRIAEPVPAAEDRAPVEAFSPKVSTTLRIDGQHHVYYQIINDHSGEVVCEIPCEQIRKLEEESSAPPDSKVAGLRIDVKS